MEEIPTCAKICSEPLECNDICVLKCHRGEHSCGKTIEKSCRCGTEKVIKKCNDRKDFLCEKLCNRKKDCLRHICE